MVNPAILEYANKDARVVHVGKRAGCQSTPQAFIEKLMAHAVQQGENVVRLKGGDPFIFGRGGEEVEHLRAAGIDVTVINGITSGLAALSSLGAPLTHREHAHGVVFVTGHAAPGPCALVIYMAVSGAEKIQQELLTGLPPHTPVAIIENASLPQQRHALTNLALLSHTLQAQQLKSPSVIVVGDVVQGARAWLTQTSETQKVRHSA